MSLAWSVIPFSKWLTTMVRKSPKDRIISLPHVLFMIFMAYKWGVILTTYPSPGMILQVQPGSFQDIHEALEEVIPFD